MKRGTLCGKAIAVSRSVGEGEAGKGLTGLLGVGPSQRRGRPWVPAERYGYGKGQPPAKNFRDKHAAPPRR